MQIVKNRCWERARLNAIDYLRHSRKWSYLKERINDREKEYKNSLDYFFVFTGYQLAKKEIQIEKKIKRRFGNNLGFAFDTKFEKKVSKLDSL